MDVLTQSSLLAAIVTGAIAVAIQIRGRRSELHTYFVVLNYVLAAWNLCSFLFQVTGGLMWFRASLFAALIIPWAGLRFFQTFLGEASILARRATHVTAVLSGLLTPVIASPLYDNSYVHVFLLVYVFVILYLCMFFIYRRLRAAQSRVERGRLWYLVIGGLVAITFSLTDYLPKLDVFFPTVGNVFTVIFMYFLSQILVQYRLLDLNELFGKIAVLGLLGTLLAAIYGLLIFLVGDQPGLLFFTSLVASFVVLILFEPLKSLVEEKIVRYSLREHFEFERQLASLRREMANVLELSRLVELIFERFENSRRITHASLYLLEDAAHAYKCIGHVGPAPEPTLDGIQSRALIDTLREGSPIIRESIHDELLELKQVVAEEEKPSEEITLRYEQLESILDSMEMLKAGVVLPILSESRLIGLLGIWDERVAEAFSKEEIRSAAQVASQVAIVIENSRMVEKLRERDRLAAIGEMSAGLAHEIRNPLGAIKGAAQLLADPELVEDDELEEFLGIIIEEVDRLNNVVSQFLDYARPDRTAFEALDLNTCIERTVSLMKQEAEDHEVAIELELSTELPEVSGDMQRLTQVFLNLGLNAVQAMEPGGTLSISTSIVTRKEPGLGGTLSRDVVQARFADSGKGMSPEELQNIFIPFFTTKQDGTGLGLPICQRIIKSLGGAIEVSSQQGEGTIFHVYLPIWGDEVITGSLRRDAGTSRSGEHRLSTSR